MNRKLTRNYRLLRHIKEKYLIYNERNKEKRKKETRKKERKKEKMKERKKET